MTASAPTGLTFDAFVGVPFNALVTALGALAAPAMAFDTAAASDTGFPAGLTLNANGTITGTPTGAATSHFGSNYSTGNVGAGNCVFTVKDTGNSITGISVTIRLHNNEALPDETDTTLSTPAQEATRENLHN